MKIAFLYPGDDPTDALTHWIKMIGRYCLKHTVEHVLEVEDCRRHDVVFLLSQNEVYPRRRMQADMDLLRGLVPFAVIHNHDNPAVPLPGDYVSFCWTQTAVERLQGYQDLHKVRQPVFPSRVFFRKRPLHIGTFGHIEPKKQTLEMAQWASANRITFTAFAPLTLTKLYANYIGLVREAKANVVLHPFFEDIETLAELLDDISHFLFVLPPSKEGTGGSSTSPRYATLFNRPVIVVDDEDTLAEDNMFVVSRLEELSESMLLEAKLPLHHHDPDQYLSELLRWTLAAK